MRIAIDIDGQFGVKMTGVQHYVDSLLTALYASDTPHEIVAFAPSLHHPGAIEAEHRDGLFLWWDSPRARVQSAGSAGLLSLQPGIASRQRLLPLAHRLDQTLLHTLKHATREARVRWATRRFDVLHVPTPLPFQGAHRARRHVVTIYDMTTRLFPQTHTAANIAAWETFYDFARHRCERVLTISESSRRDIAEHLGIAPERIVVTPLAPRATTRPVADRGALRAALQKWDLAEAPFVLCAATLERRKNLERLVEGFALLVRQEKLAEHRLVLAGGSREGYEEELRARARDLGIAERLVLPGYVSNAELNALMTGCACFAYLSLYEGFGLPPLEAMVCGAPVVVSNTSSLPEVVGAAGIQVAPEDVEGIAAALCRLLCDGEENARQRALSRARAAEFSWERTAGLTLRAYEAALAHP